MGRRLRIVLLNVLLLHLLVLAPTLAHAINVTTIANDGVTTAQITAALQGAGVTISNLVVTNNGCANRTQAVGLFSQGTTPTGPGPVLGDTSGVVLGTGPLKTAGDFLVSPNSDPRWDNTLCTGNVSDADMVLLEGQTANGEYMAIEFDIVPQYSTMAIPFQFGSDEFPEYVCTTFNDVTGIFVRGPGIAGPFSGGAQNYAKTPGGDLTSINWVNTGVIGSNGTLARCGSLTNTAYYTDNSNGDPAGGNATVATTNANLELDGWTNYIYQPITVVPGQTYHVKAAIADAGDRQWDSAVFFHLIFSTNTLLGFDFGDAPDSYRTLTSSGGPRHAINNSIYLGTIQPDNEVTGQPTAAANGDDTTGSDDEDGVASFPALLTSASNYSVNIAVNNTTGSTATLVGWIDFNRNGTFEAAEGVSTSIPTGTVNGSATLNWNSLSGLVAGTTYTRFRISTSATLTTATPGGTAGNGEVEDYTLEIREPNLSTSTKSVTDLNGGDAEPGDVLRYTITLIESNGVAANNVTISDNIPANTSGFTVFSLPAGATNSSTGAGTGTNGTGYLNTGNISIAASGTETIVFEVTIASGTPPATAIDNTATVTVPGGVGATPSAPTVYVSGGSIPGSGNKPLYISGAPGLTLSRTPTTGTPAYITIAELGTQTWTLSAPLETDVTLDPALSATVPINLYMASNQARTISATVTLSCSSGGSINQTLSENLDTTPEIYDPPFDLPLSAPLTCPAGSTWSLTIRNNTSGNGTRDLRVYPVNGTNLNPAIPNGHVSQAILPSRNVINLDNSDIVFYDAAYPGGSSVATVNAGSTVYVRATVSDPFGSYDISGATLTLTDPLGAVQVNAAAMTQVFDSGTATKAYQYQYSVPATGPAGTWIARVVAREGSEGTVTDYAQQSFTVSQPLPALTFLKASRIAADPVNGTTSPKAIPGADVIYSLKITNFGTGAAESLVFTDPVPANTKLFVGDLGQGSPVFFSNGAISSGFLPADVGVSFSSTADCANYSYDPVPTADANGYNTDVCNLRITMNNAKTLPGGSAEFNLEFKVRIE